MNSFATASVMSASKIRVLIAAGMGHDTSMRTRVQKQALTLTYVTHQGRGEPRMKAR